MFNHILLKFFPAKNKEITKIKKRVISFLPKTSISATGYKINKGQKVLIVEDVITTGKSSLECSDLIKKSSGDIVGYACIIDRSNGKSLIKNKIVSQVEIDIPTYKKAELPKHLNDIKAVKPGSRNL